MLQSQQDLREEKLLLIQKQAPATCGAESWLGFIDTTTTKKNNDDNKQ